MTNFNPRSPHGERPAAKRFKRWVTSISIHAPRTGSDAPISHPFTLDEYHFNPRSPHGERRFYIRKIAEQIKFQSTLPARGATDRVPHVVFR